MSCIIEKPKGHKLDRNLNGQGEKGKILDIFFEKKIQQRANKTILEIQTNRNTKFILFRNFAEICKIYENLYTSKSTNDEKAADYIEKVIKKLNTQDKKIRYK